MMRIDPSTILKAAAPILLGLLLGAAFAAAAGAAEPSKPASESLKQDAAETYADSKQYSYEQKEQLAGWLRERMAAADRQIEELEAKARDAGDAAAGKWQATRRALAEKRAALGEQAQALGEASQSAWDSAKRKVASAYDDLKQGFQDAKKSME
ncbi:MAG: hypothetical protein AB7G39_06470 [Alphaproteobacteria bacterium]